MARRSKKPARPSLIEEGWWDRLDGRVQHGVCIVVLLAIAIGFYAPVLFSGRSLIGDDTVRWRAMAEYMIEYEEETGRQALWAPNAFAGMPGYMIAYGDRIPQLDEIPSLLREAAWPVSHFVFLILGCYAFVFFLTRNRLAGVLGAAAYGLTTYMAVILVAGHNSKFITLCFAPWLVLAFAYVFRQPKLLSGLLFAAALALNLQGGHVQITYYVSILLGIWWIVEVAGAVRSGDWKPTGAATAYLALGSVLGLLLVAQPYLPAFEYKQYTIRGATAGAAGLDWSYAMGWSQGVGELITLIAADAYGGASPTYWGPKAFTQGPHYVGAVVFFLAVIAVWRWRKPVVWSFGAGAVIMMLFSLGSNFGFLNRPMYEHFPLFNAFRVPETWLSVAAFALAVLGAVGLHAIGKDTSSDANRAALISAGAVAALLAGLWLLSGSLFDFERPNEEAQVTQQLLAQRPDISPDDPRVETAVSSYIEEQRGVRQNTFNTEMLRALAFLILAGGLVAAYRGGKIPRWSMQAAVALLVVVDLWGVGRRYFDEESLVQSDDAEEQIATYDFDRFLVQRQEEAGGMGRFRVLSLESGTPFQYARPNYHHESIGGYHGAKLRLIQDYIDELFFDAGARGPNENALDLLNTRYVVASGTLPGMETVFRGEQTGMYVLENTDALPRAFFVGETEVVEGPEEAYQRLRSSEFDPRTTALLYEALDFEPAPIDSASTARAEVSSYTPNELVVDVETDEPRLLVLSEVYYPAGWTASVDGEEVPIHRVDHLLRAVRVSAGTHQVVMRFDPSSHRVGLWISGLSTVLVYGLALGLMATSWLRSGRRGSDSADA